jgi:toxin ParE1/3/4
VTLAKARLSRLAEQDLLDIWTYIAKDNPDAADRFTDLLSQKCDNLCDFPEVGTRRDELAPSLRSFPVGRYVIFYRLGDPGIEVARILSAYRDLGQFFGGA